MKRGVKETGVSVDVVLVRGTPFREIVETAKTKQVDLVVMGTHGRTGVSHLLIGFERVAPGAVSGSGH